MNTKAFPRFAASIVLILAGCANLQAPSPPLTPANFAAVTHPPINVPPDPLDTLPPALRQAYLNKSDKPVQSGFATFYPYRQYEEPTIRRVTLPRSSWPAMRRLPPRQSATACV